jgi:RND superfamily putative drug exporter
VPFAGGLATRRQVSRAGDLAYTVLAVPNHQRQNAALGKKLRSITGSGAGGLHVYVTGDLGFNADFEKVFKSFDTKLLLATVLLVLVLLLLIYRSPLIALAPLLVVGISYSAARAFVYLLAKSGETVSSNTTTILVVLMFGVGTDYCLLLVSRYREELRQIPDKHEAMATALRRVGPAILASGLTVALTMLVLLWCETGTLRSLGPASAIGVTCAFAAGITLLPAVLTIVGRNGFWPRRALIAFDPEAIRHEQPGLWRRIGDRVLQRPLPILAATVALFGAGAVGLIAYKENYSTTGVFTQRTESVDGFKAMQRAFPAGALAPTDLIVERPSGAVQPADIAAASRRLAGVPGVAAVLPPRERSRDGRAVRMGIVLHNDPYTTAGFDVTPKLRAAVRNLGTGARGLVGGGSATQYDFNHATARDTRLVVPIALAVIAVILGVLLQALAAPVVLIASVVLSFFGTLGLSMLVFRYVAGENGVDNSLPVFSFIFLVALGTDYTIFLMSRVREEARRHGTREGMLRALGATGPVITSAGIILAGTFSVLMTLPVWFIFNIGFVVAVGILLDTFVVRTIMVPAAVELLGDRIWWPTSARRRGGLFRAEPDGAGGVAADGELEPAADQRRGSAPVA